MEIRVDVLNSQEELIISSYFLYVSRNSQDTSKPYVVPALTFDDEFAIPSCQLRQEVSADNQKGRKEKRLNGTSQAPPTSNENLYIHKLMNENLFGAKLVSKDVVKLADERLEKVQMMHYQHCNVHGKIFGGYLMRQSSELT
jgi:acyl-coenzyme A thioesterase 9